MHVVEVTPYLAYQSSLTDVGKLMDGLYGVHILFTISVGAALSHPRTLQGSLLDMDGLCIICIACVNLICIVCMALHLLHCTIQPQAFSKDFT